MNKPSTVDHDVSQSRKSGILDIIIRPHPYVKKFGDQQKVKLVATVSLGLLAISLLAIPVVLILAPRNSSSWIINLVTLVLVFGIAYIFSWTTFYSVGSWILLFTRTIAAYIGIGNGSNIIAMIALDIGFSFVIGSSLLSIEEMLILIIGNALVYPVAAVFIGRARPAEIAEGIISIIALGGFTLFGLLIRNNLERRQEKELNEANVELNDVRSSLEKNVEDRTQELSLASEESKHRTSQLEAISQVAQAITQLRDINILLPSITQLISEHFGFYHVGIFLLDETREFAVLRATNSEGGQRMLARGHRLKVGQTGIVGYVADHAEPRISLDVGGDAVFFDNPDLPGTRSEMALPLKIGERVIGVLDVQSEGPAAFGSQNIEVMNTLADQVAIAIENARLYSEMQRALVEAQVSYGQYLRQAWDQIPMEYRVNGYRYAGVQLDVLEEPLELPEIYNAAQSGEAVKLTETAPCLAVPLKLRNEVIGVIDIRANDPKRKWNEDELLMVQAIADRVAIALENARLFEETTRRADRERAVSEITTRIRSATDPQIMLQTALEELKQVLGAGDVQVRPFNPRQSENNNGKKVVDDKSSSNTK